MKMVSEDPSNFETKQKHRQRDFKCHEKALQAGELTFTLREQDMTSPFIILEWIKLNFKTCPNEKLIEAFENALAMKDSKIQKKAAD